MSVPVRTKNVVGVWTRLVASSVGLAVLLAACEDEGNPGNDNLLTGGSLVVIVLVVAVVVLLVMRRRRG